MLPKVVIFVDVWNTCWAFLDCLVGCYIFVAIGINCWNEEVLNESSSLVGSKALLIGNKDLEKFVIETI